MNWIGRLWNRIVLFLNSEVYLINKQDNSTKFDDDYISLLSHDFEFIEVNLNGKFIPPGNVSEVVLPNSRMGCFALQGTFNGKWHKIYASGLVNIIAMPREELEAKKVR